MFLTRLIRDDRGVSAVEFALVAPLMLSLYLGCTGLSDGVSADRKLTLVASTVANLVAQSTSLSSSDMSNIFNASGAIMLPYTTSSLQMTVSCLAIDANKDVTVKWSAGYNGVSALSGSVTIPTDLKVANSQIILANATYAYTPPVGSGITGTLNLSEKMYMTPRISAPSYPDSTHACT
jgi:Flp pilus assembly protein TadG